MAQPTEEGQMSCVGTQCAQTAPFLWKNLLRMGQANAGNGETVVWYHGGWIWVDKCG